jgi:hypothetical protein
MSIEDWTRPQCAEHWGISPSTWSGYVARGHAPQPYTWVGRTPLWDADTVRTYPRPGQGARTDLKETTVQNPQRLTEQITTTLGDHADDFDVEAIVDEIGEAYGYDLASIDGIPADEYAEILQRHDTTA